MQHAVGNMETPCLISVITHTFCVSFVCIFAEWVEYNGSEYLFSIDNLTWDLAQSECERLSANLTSITSQQEQDFIIEEINNGQVNNV